MGQKKSSPWFIIRMGFGFTGLVPIFGGYCGAQMIMLWGTMLGVGIANLSLDAGVTVLNSGGSMIATPASPQATTLAKALFEANLCAQSANAAIANMPNDSGVSVDAAENFNPITSSNKIVLMNQRGLSCGGAEIDITQPPSLPSYDGMACLLARAELDLFSDADRASGCAYCNAGEFVCRSAGIRFGGEQPRPAGKSAEHDQSGGNSVSNFHYTGDR